MPSRTWGFRTILQAYRALGGVAGAWRSERLTAKACVMVCVITPRYDTKTEPESDTDNEATNTARTRMNIGDSVIFGDTRNHSVFFVFLLRNEEVSGSIPLSSTKFQRTYPENLATNKARNQNGSAKRRSHLLFQAGRLALQHPSSHPQQFVRRLYGWGSEGGRFCREFHSRSINYLVSSLTEGPLSLR